MKFKALTSWGGLAIALAVVALIGRADPIGAQTFNPTLTVSITDPQPEISSDIVASFDLPDGDVQFAGLVAFLPGDWGIVPGSEIPIGASIGELTSDVRLGLINAPCNSEIEVFFDMMNASLDRNDTVSFSDEDGDNTADFAQDSDGNGLDDAIDRYPDFINRIIDEDPIRRSAGITIVAGAPILLQFLVFPPGTEIDELIPSDPDLGYPTVTLLQNAGDPDIEPEPGIITDFCTPLATLNTTFGTTPDGDAVMVNPQNGTYTYHSFALGLRDADGDGYENLLDTCAYIPNLGNPRVQIDGDLDGDGLDGACDPNDDPATGGTDSDEDADGYSNRQDNCPIVPNGLAEDNQADEDNDQIGDACDTDPTVADGELSSSSIEAIVTIGDGTGAGGRPDCAAIGVVCYDPGSDSPDGGDDDGGSSSGIIIVVAVIAAVVIIGGGAALMMRRRETT